MTENELLELCKNLRRHIDVKGFTQDKIPYLAIRLRSDDVNYFNRVVRPQEIRDEDESFGAALTRWIAFVDWHELESKVERTKGMSITEGKIG